MIADPSKHPSPRCMRAFPLRKVRRVRVCGELCGAEFAPDETGRIERLKSYQHGSNRGWRAHALNPPAETARSHHSRTPSPTRPLVHCPANMQAVPEMSRPSNRQFLLFSRLKREKISAIFYPHGRSVSINLPYKYKSRVNACLKPTIVCFRTQFPSTARIPPDKTMFLSRL